MWRRLLPLLVLVALVALVAAACGDDESVFEQGGVTTAAPTTTAAATGYTGAEVTTTTSAPTTTEAAETTLGGGEQAMADQIAAELLAGGGGELGLSIDEEAAQCLGNQMVTAFGFERLQELADSGGEGGLGTAVEQMTPEELSTLTGVILNGIDGQPACVDVRSLLVEAFVQSGLSPSSAECVADAFTQGTVLQDMLASALGAAEAGGEMDPEVMAQLMTVMMGCLTPEELADLGGIDLGS